MKPKASNPVTGVERLQSESLLSLLACCTAETPRLWQAAFSIRFDKEKQLRQRKPGAIGKEAESDFHSLRKADLHQAPWLGWHTPLQDLVRVTRAWHLLHASQHLSHFHFHRIQVRSLRDSFLGGVLSPSSAWVCFQACFLGSVLHFSHFVYF